METTIFNFDNWVITAYNWTDTDIVIPETINWQPVIWIGDKAFFEKNIKSVKLPSTLKFIWEKAFKWNQIEDIELPNWLEMIEDWALLKILHYMIVFVIYIGVSLMKIKLKL